MILRFIVILFLFSTSFCFTISPIFNEWFCLDFLKNIDKSKPLKYQIGDLPLVIWFNNSKLLLSTINICSHYGSRLDKGNINKKGCLVCPYHGLEYNKKMTFGKTMIHQGKLWWSYENKNKPPSIPFYNNNNYETIEISSDINANVLDCIYNMIDINHPKFVHNNPLSFGSDNEPINLKLTKYPNKKKVGIFFNYKANKNLFNLKKELNNSNSFHIYDYPFNTWSRVTILKNQNLFMNINFLPLNKDKTRLFITIKHNYWKSNFEQNLMKIAINKILDEDKEQLNYQSKETILKNKLMYTYKLKNEDHLLYIRSIIKNNNNNSLSLYPSIDN